MKTFPMQKIGLIISDTRVNILASTPTSGDVIKAYATDTKQSYIYSDGIWKELSSIQIERTSSYDMGSEQTSNLAGYGFDYITDKVISNSSIGSNALTDLGGLRTIFSASLERDLFQVYLQDNWQTILTGINIQTDPFETPVDIEFTDFAPWVLSLITGNSDSKDSNRVATVQNMKIDMGAYSAPLTIDGGTF